MDSRIGSKYLTGAVAYGGPCFPRDNVALTRVAQRVGAEAPLAEATDRFNRKQSHMLAELIQRTVQPGGHVTVLGLSYKPETSVVEESASLYLIWDLLDMGYKVSGYDPAGMDNARQIFGSAVSFPETLDDAVKSGDVIVIATAWKVFGDLSPDSLRRAEGASIIIDCWRILDAERYKGVAQIVHLGKGYSFEQADALGMNTGGSAF
jgi:UDPglucose 6-dehydrogenase